MSAEIWLPALFREPLEALRRSPDGLLHASSDLTGSLRHSMLRAAGAPTLPTAWTSEITLMTGTMWHQWAHESLVAAGQPLMQEVRLDPWMPEGRSGTPARPKAFIE